MALQRVKGMRSPASRDDQFLGAVTVLNVFASWCGPCQAEQPPF